MARNTRREVTPDTTPQRMAETTPQSYPLSDHSFTLQAIMEMQKTLGELTQAVRSLTEESKKNGVALEDIGKKMYAAKIVLWIFGVIFTATSGVTAFFLNKFWDKIFNLN